MRHLGTVIAFAVIAIAATAEAQDAGPSLGERIAALGAAPCDLGALTCVTLTVPRDHFANDQSETLDITFAVSLATEPSQGTIIYVVGGPGYSGLAVADDYLSVYDPDFVAMMDIVFFDQRGIGPVHGFYLSGRSDGF